MAEYKIFQKNRKIKQAFMSVIFAIILIGGWFYPILGYFVPLCMLLGVSIGFFKGRKWCDWKMECRIGEPWGTRSLWKMKMTLGEKAAQMSKHCFLAILDHDFRGPTVFLFS